MSRAALEIVHLSLLRGVCQLPGYVAQSRGIFRRHGLDVQVNIAPTAWMVPERLTRGEVQFAVMPWTRVVGASAKGEPLVLICGSGCEEAAIVLRTGVKQSDVKKVAIPQRGGIKDLTAMGLLRSLGWGNAHLVRMPSGDGAILSLVGQGADAASMVEPYATMLQEQGIGQIVRRTGDLWRGAPGCSLTTTADMIEDQPKIVQRMVDAYVEAAQFVERNPDEAAAIGGDYIGVDARFIRAALRSNRPNIHALEQNDSMNAIIDLMTEMNYIDGPPTCCFYERQFLTKTQAGALA
jgi:NitT/TauT family transport system substrate-binding protein